MRAIVLYEAFFEGKHQMAYLPSSRFIKTHRNGGRKVMLGMTCAMIFVVFVVRKHPATAADPSSAAAVLILMLFMAGAIGWFQIRAMRRTASELSKVSFDFSSEGIVVNSPNKNFVMPFVGIASVKVYRRKVNHSITNILLSGRGGDLQLPELEEADAFVTELSEHIGQSKIIDRRSVFGWRVF